MPTKRFAHVQQLVAVREALARGEADPDLIVTQAIITALPVKYRAVFHFVKSHRGNVPSSMVSVAFWRAQNYSSSILNELWQFGLLERVEEITENGKRYLYS